MFIAALTVIANEVVFPPSLGSAPFGHGAHFLPLLTCFPYCEGREAQAQIAAGLHYSCFVTLEQRESCSFPEAQGRGLCWRG